MSTVKKRIQCPECVDSGKDNLIVYEDESTYCFSCGYTTPKKVAAASSNSKLLPAGAPRDLTKRRITKETCDQYGVFLSEYYGDNVIVFPFYKDGKLVAQKLKTPSKEIKWIGSAKGVDYMGSQNMTSATKRIVITEGEEDCLAVAQVVGGHTHVTTLTNGAQSAERFAEAHYKKLLNYEEIVLCFDQDDAGREASKKFAKHFPVGQVSIAKLSEKDACDMLIAGKENDLKWACLKAQKETPDGVLCIKDLTEEYFNEKFESGVSLPYPILDHYLSGLRKGELTMVTAGTGIGKSTWCTNVIYDFLINKGQKVVDIKLEEAQRKSIYTYLAMYSETCPRKLREDPEIVPSEIKQSFIEDFSNLYVHNHFGSLDGKELLNIIDYYATVVKADFIFLDHISIAISGMEGSKDGERKDIDKLLTKIRELINRTGVGFICVSHLKNPPNGENQWESGRPVRRSDLRGSGSIGQLSDNIIAIEGTLTDEEKKCDRVIKLIKTRYGDTQEAYCDTFRYDIETGKIKLKKEVM